MTERKVYIYMFIGFVGIPQLVCLVCWLVSGIPVVLFPINLVLGTLAALCLSKVLIDLGRRYPDDQQ